MKHVMEMKTEYLGVQRGGIQLKITGDGVAIGTLEVSNATLKWYPKSSKKKCAPFSWEEFANVMSEYIK